MLPKVACSAALAAIVIMTVSMAVVLASGYNFYVYPTRTYMRPLVAGLQIEFVGSSIYPKACTLGYFAVVNNHYAIVSAAHCQVEGANYVYQPNDSSSAYLIGYPLESSRNVDAVVVVLKNNVHFSASVIYITGRNSYLQVAITGYENFNTLPMGSHVCKTGRTTGTTCGVVLAKYFRYDNASVSVYDVIVTNVTAAEGDSGSPLYYKPINVGTGPQTYIIGHVIAGISNTCSKTYVNGEEVSLCRYTVAVSASAVKKAFGLELCTVYGCW